MNNDENTLNDRFFLEEIFYNLCAWSHNKDEQFIYNAGTLVTDWLNEVVTKTPLSEEDRKKYLKETYVGQDTFDSEKELSTFLETGLNHD